MEYIRRERVLGGALKELARRDQVVVATKAFAASRLQHLDEAIAAVGLRLSEAEIARFEKPSRPLTILGHS